MTKFLSFKIRNANPFRKVDLDLDRKGLVRLAGRNGEGKSSLWHLLTFLFFGISPNKAGKSDLAMDAKDFLLECSFEKNSIQYIAAMAAKSKCKSPLGEVYGTGYFFFRKDESGWVDISWHKALDTQKFVREILGWSLEEWYGYVYQAQQTSHVLINGTPGERQKYLSAIFNLDPLDRIADHYKQKALQHSEAVQELERKKHELELLSQRMTTMLSPEQIEQAIKVRAQLAKDYLIETDHAKAEHAKWETLNQLRSKFDTFPRGLTSQLEKTREEIEETIADKALYEGKIKEVKEFDEELKISSEEIERRKTYTWGQKPEDFDRVMSVPDISLEEDEKYVRYLRGKKKQVENAPTDPPEISDDMDDILASPDIDLVWYRRNIEQIKSRPAAPAMNRPTTEDLDELRMAQSNAQAAIMFCHDRRAQLMIEGSCPTCGTELDPKHREKHREKVDQELQEAEQTKKKVNSLLGDLEVAERAWVQYDKLGPDRSAELPQLEDAVVRFEKKQTYLKVEEELERYVQAERDRREILEIPARVERIDLYKKKQDYRKGEEDFRLLEGKKLSHSQLKAERDQASQELPDQASEYDFDERLKDRRAKEKNILEAQEIERNINELKKEEPRELTEEIQHLETCLRETQQQTGTLQEKLKDSRQAQQDHERLEKDISEQESVYREQKKCEILAKNYGKAGRIRQLHLKKFSGFLEEALLCHTFRLLPDHRIQIVVEDGIEIKTSKNGCRPYDIHMMSGAEKGAMSIAFLFALDDLLPPDRKTSLKIIDEIESAFDPTRKVDFIDYMLPELRNRAETVIVISHTDMEDQNVFDRVWRVQSGEVLDASGEIREFN